MGRWDRSGGLRLPNERWSEGRCHRIIQPFANQISKPVHGAKMSTSENDALLADVEAYCQEVRPLEDLCYLEHRFNAEAIELAKKYRLFGMFTAKEYGGRGCDLTTYIKALIRIGREGTGLRTLFSGHISIGQMPIIEWGNAEQKKRYLSAAAKGDKIMAFGLA